MKVLQVFCDLCGPFLKKRVIEEVWPSLIQTLQELLPIATDHAHFKGTQQHKLLTNVISSIPHICSKVYCIYDSAHTIIV